VRPIAPASCGGFFSGILQAMEAFVAALTVFVLAIFLGFEVITKVPPTLHTPLMSGSNAISGITIIGAILSAGAQHTTLSAVLGVLAVVLATINVVGRLPGHRPHAADVQVQPSPTARPSGKITWEARRCESNCCITQSAHRTSVRWS
jgi:NAD(P) transhydrogenase subunit alpha